MQSFLLRVGTASQILSHLSCVLAGKVFKACSNSFCSSVVHGAGLVPASRICCSTIAVKISHICSIHQQSNTVNIQMKLLLDNLLHQTTYSYFGAISCQYYFLLLQILYSLFKKYYFTFYYDILYLNLI